MPSEIAAGERDGFSRLSPGRRILAVYAEMERGAHWRERGDEAEAKRCYARALALMDRICGTLLGKPSWLREYRRWREWAGGLYLGDYHPPGEREALERALLWLDPESWRALAV